MELGTLIMMVLYHSVLFVQIKRRYYLYMSLICAVIFIRACLVENGSMLLYRTFPILEDVWGKKLEFFVVYSTPFLVPMFIHDLFNFEIFKKYVRFFQWVGGAMMLWVLFTPYTWYRPTLNLYHVLMTLSFVLVFMILIRAMKRKRTSANYIFFGITICFGFVVLEMVKNSGYFEVLDFRGPNLVNTGVVAYLFFQSVALSSIFARSFEENKKLNSMLEERVAARTEQLSKANVVRERFVNIVSHDLRGPLANLKSTIELSTAGVITKESEQDLMRKMKVGVDESLKMLDDLLEWTNANANRVSVYKERVDLNSLISECLETFTEMAASKKIKLEFDDEEHVFMDSDRNALKVILRNLVFNSIKFTPEGGTVTLRVINSERRVVLHVLDTGIGVPDDMKRTIFSMDRKNQRVGTANEKSSGIGLALVKDIVQQNGGTIWVEDNRKSATGAVFKCSFPKY